MRRLTACSPPRGPPTRMAGAVIACIGADGPGVGVNVHVDSNHVTHRTATGSHTTHFSVEWEPRDGLEHAICRAPATRQSQNYREGCGKVSAGATESCPNRDTCLHGVYSGKHM